MGLAKRLPLWYDATCCVTSVTFAIVAFLLYRLTKDATWVVVVLSGVVSAWMRRTRMRRDCNLKWGWLCSPSTALLFYMDLLFAILAFLVFAMRVDLVDLSVVVGLMVVGWIVFFCGKSGWSCVLHSAGHLIVCASMFKMLLIEKRGER